MWAQLIKLQVKPGRADEIAAVMDRLHEAEQPGSGLIRTTVMQHGADPHQVYVLVVFESEESARTREQDPRRREALGAVQATMADLFIGAPDYVDLTVLQDVAP